MMQDTGVLTRSQASLSVQHHNNSNCVRDMSEADRQTGVKLQEQDAQYAVRRFNIGSNYTAVIAATVELARIAAEVKLIVLLRSLKKPLWMQPVRAHA